jgi:hypothetical protein
MPAPLQPSEVLADEYYHLHGVKLSFTTATEKKRFAEAVAAFHQQEHTALCISGGGIRSATFSLGVIQALAHLGAAAGGRLLTKFHYLSTVSGGGFIGSWLSAAVARGGRTIEEVAKELDTKLDDKLKPEPAILHHLRTYSNYLTPKLGLFSADTWALIATYGRNLILTWLILLPFLLAVLAVPRLFVSLILWTPPDSWGPALMHLLQLLFIFALGYLAISRPVKRGKPAPTNKDDTAFAHFGDSGFTVYCLLPLGLTAIGLAAGKTWWPHWWQQESLSKMTVQTAVISALVSLVYSIRYFAGGDDPGERPPGESHHAYAVRKLLLELFGAAVSGALFGVLVYCFLNLMPLKLIQAPSAMSWYLKYPPDLSTSGAAKYVVLAAPLILFALHLQATLFVGLTGRLSGDYDREWWARASGWVLVLSVAWMLLTATAIFGPVGIYFAPRTIAGTGVLTGVFAALLGKSAKTAANPKQKGEESTLGKAMNVALGLAAPIFALCLLAGLSLGTTKVLRAWEERQGRVAARTQADDQTVEALKRTSWHVETTQKTTMGLIVNGDAKVKTIDLPAVEADHLAALDHLYVTEMTLPQEALVLVFGLFVFSILASWIIGVNRFSMHALYRNRLIRAYLAPSNTRRKPNPFSGFDPDDNLQMWELRKTNQPFHIINMAMNLTTGDDLAWQQRRAESFTVSPLHCGSVGLGYRPAHEYGGPNGISVGTAVTISGAAVSPNMGYHSSPTIAFLLTLFNVRLGAWLGNPGKPGEKTYKLRSPEVSLKPLLQDMLGQTDAKNPYVYLSDGAHFENLGLYEMVMRRCRRIVVIDAGQDDKFIFDDLGNAIRKIRTDLGIRVDVDRRAVFPRKNETEPENPKYCAYGTIRYSAIDGSRPQDDGEFVYIKPVFYGKTEPTDVYNYATENPAFPHESTGDQWFSESQFESYRALGEHVVLQEICKGKDQATLADFMNRAKDYVEEREPGGPTPPPAP